MTLFPELRSVDRIAIDTETTGVRWRDRAVGLSYATPDGRQGYFAWGHEAGGNNCSLADVIRWARAELPKVPLVLMHNAAFDLRMTANAGVDITRMGPRVEDTGVLAAILNELEPSLSLDALGKAYTGLEKSDVELNAWCAARFRGQATRKSQAEHYWQAPGSLVAPYAEHDARMTLALYDARRPLIDAQILGDVYDLECQVIPVVHRMNQAGVRVNVDRADQVKAGLRERLKAAQGRWNRDVGEDVNYRSTAHLAKLFRALGLPVWKTEAGADSITKDLLKLLDHPVAQMVVELKSLERLGGVFIDKYILANVGGDGRIHPEFHQVKNDQYGTVSGRFSSGGELCAQNFPSPDKDAVNAAAIRGLFIPESDDHDWVKPDYSQIEYRYLAHYARGGLERAYRENPRVDFHQMTADIAGIKRGDAKTTNFAVVYGQGVAATAVKLNRTVEEAKAFVSGYYQRAPEIKELYDLASSRANTRGYIRTWGGRVRRFVKREKGRGYDHTHKALNALLQGSAADLMKKALVRVDQLVDWDASVIHLTIHDELDLSIPKGADGQRLIGDIKAAMEDFPLRVPIVADVDIGPDWGHVDEWTPAM